MKVANSIREIYDERLSVYESLKAEVDNFFFSNKRGRWHYESRVKELDSFALKAETSRIRKISELEDFFGACLVVENNSSVEDALNIIKSRFKIAYQRPIIQGETHKAPSSFVFDDLRLYLRIPQNPDRRSKGIENIIFELQLKTFLQHAWSIATHDLIYKGDESSWASSRIAYQVKAMLEHAELSISESDALSKSPLVSKTSKNTTTSKSIILYLRNLWGKDQLPKDLIRLSDNVIALMNIVNLDVDTLKKMTKKSKYIGNKPKTNISPFSAIALTIIEHVDDITLRLKKKKKKIFLPMEAISLLTAEKKKALERVLIQPE